MPYDLNKDYNPDYVEGYDSGFYDGWEAAKKFFGIEEARVSDTTEGSAE